MKATLELEGYTFDVTLEQDDSGAWTAEVDGHRYPVHVDRRAAGTVVSVGDAVHVLDELGTHSARIDGQETPYRILALQGVAGAEDTSAGAYGPVRPPMIGKLEAILVEAGQEVDAGDVLFILEAMKMRNEVKAAAAGVIEAIHAAVGDAVDTGTTILHLAPVEE